MSINNKDKQILRDLAKRYAEIAALPVQAEKRKQWTELNGLRQTRPMVMIDQICWNELNQNGELSPKCTDPSLIGMEMHFRMLLYRWEHFPVDMVFEPWFEVSKAVHNSGFGVNIQEETQSTSENARVVSRCYENQFVTEEDLKKIKTPIITHNEEETARRQEHAHEILDGILEVRTQGTSPYISLWDPIAMWMSVEDALYTVIDRPEYFHEILGLMTDGYMSMLDQLEEQGLLCTPQSNIHCTGAYSDELPGEGYDDTKPRCKDLWVFGLAQMLSTVSPAMFDEFEVQYTSKLCDRFGLVYYGCCDPLDQKMEQVRKLPNVRKISMSPWADQENGALEIGKEFVFSSKPNPANVAMTSFNGDLVRKELSEIKAACDKNGCPLEFILKDISTLKNEPERLDQWAKIAMEVAEG